MVDLGEVEFVDSTVLGVLLEARSRLGPNGLAVANPRLEIRRALEVSGLDRHLSIHDSVDRALGTLTDDHLQLRVLETLQGGEHYNRWLAELTAAVPR